MHWIEPFFMAQIIQVAVILILIRGLSVISRALGKMEERFRNSLLLVIASFIFYIFLAISFSILIYKQISYDSYLWIIPPSIGLICSVGLVLGGKKLLEAIEYS